MGDLVMWLRDMASGPMAQNPEHTETCNKLTAAADEIKRLQGIVRLARMLIQPDESGPVLQGHKKFRDALLLAVRDLRFSDPVETKVERLQRIVNAGDQLVEFVSSYLRSGYGGQSATMDIERSLFEYRKAAETADVKIHIVPAPPGLIEAGQRITREAIAKQAAERERANG